jgi:Fe2+ transport system protein FeoA
MNPFATSIETNNCDASCDKARCRKPAACPLSRVKEGVAVRIKKLATPPEVTRHLREIGFGEQQVIRLLIRQSNLICEVCNARLALSSQLAQMIIVEPLVP